MNNSNLYTTITPNITASPIPIPNSLTIFVLAAAPVYTAGLELVEADPCVPPPEAPLSGELVDEAPLLPAALCGPDDPGAAPEPDPP